MIFQTYRTIADVNTTAGPHTLFVYAAEIVPSFIPMVIFAIFLIALLGSYFSQRRLTGSGDFPASFAAASFISTIIAFVMSLLPGLINNNVVIIMVVISVLSVVWLYLSRGDTGI